MSADKIGVVLVPVDGSEGAEHAVRHACTVAAAVGAPVRLLFAFPRDAIEMFGTPAEVPTAEQLKYLSEDAFAALRDETAGKVFGHARRVIADCGASAEEVLLAGTPARAILEHAGQCDHPLIVVGRRGLSRFSELLLGSVSQRLVHEASCPVTVVR